MRIAIMGAGNAAAWALSRCHSVTVYERKSRPGGPTSARLRRHVDRAESSSTMIAGEMKTMIAW
jgi:predicted NAD/FAD-binding protein